MRRFDRTGVSFLYFPQCIALGASLMLIVVAGCGDRPDEVTKTATNNNSEPSAVQAREQADPLQADPLQADAKQAAEPGAPSADNHASAPTTGSAGGETQQDQSADDLPTDDLPTDDVPASVVDKPASSEPVITKSVAPTPTAEQVDAWAIQSTPRLELVHCLDGFGNSTLSSLCVSSDGTHFAVGGERLILFATKGPTLIAELTKELPNDIDHYVLCTDFSQDGSVIASGDQGGTVRIWGVQRQEQIATWQAHDSRVSEIAVSPNGKVLATTSYSGDVSIWEIESGKKITSLKAASQEIGGLRFLTNKSLASIGGEVAIWSLPDGNRIHELASNVFASAIAASVDGAILAYASENNKLILFDTAKEQVIGEFSGHHGPVEYADLSSDGTRVATSSQDKSIRISDVKTGRPIQVMDTYGSRVIGLRWLPGDGLLIASDNGRVRLWGVPGAETLGIESNVPAKRTLVEPETGRPATSELLKQTLDTRSLDRLPDAIGNHESFGNVSYGTEHSFDDGLMFYRYVMQRDGWVENTPADESQPRISFVKGNHHMQAWFSPGSMMGFLSKQSKTAANVLYAGNVDARELPKHRDDIQYDSYSTAAYASYRTADDLTEVEAAILKRMHDAGWTAYSRLDSSNSEDPDRRSLRFVGGGILVDISLGFGAADPGKVFVQSSVGVFNQSIPIPADSGFIEHDSTHPLAMVATTKMSLNETAKFYTDLMPEHGWVSRGETIDDDHARLNFIRDQQDITLRLAKLPEGGVRILVGTLDRLSWQLKEPAEIDPKILESGIQAAEFQIPESATDTDYNMDQKSIKTIVAGKSAPDLITQYVDLLTGQGWEKDFAGILEEDYSFVTLKKGKAELDLRARKQPDGATALTISGNALLWSKALPIEPQRISYRLWLERNGYSAGLDRLDAFLAEMRKLPAVKPAY